jgi:signal transduction histidine kinase
MGNLSASLAHELSQPLGAIANLLAACEPRAAVAPDAELLDLFRQASAQSQRAGSLVAHVTRLLHGGERRVERCDLRELLMAGVQLLRPTLRRHGIARSSPSEAPLEGDVCRIEIEQVGQSVAERCRRHPATPGHRGRIGGGIDVGQTCDDHRRGQWARRLRRGQHRIFEPFFTTRPVGSAWASPSVGRS